MRLRESKTTRRDSTPPLVLKSRPARALVARIDAAGIADGPLFRPISKAGRPLARRLPADAIAGLVKHRLARAGWPAGFAPAYGPRSAS